LTIASIDVVFDVMRTTITLDDKLLSDALEYAGVKERSTVVRMALEEFVQRRAELRMAKAKGAIPEFGKVAVPRRRFPPE
jgi:Arc/MetJ family transcription regulator